VAHYAISALLVWLAVNVAFVVLRLRAPRKRPAAPDLHQASSLSPKTLRLRNRAGR